MKCADCQADVTPASVYCHRCGARLEEQLPRDDDPVDAPDETADAAAEYSGEESPRPADRLTSRVGGSAGRDDDAEKDLWQGGYSPKAMIGAWIGTGAATVVVLAMSAIGLMAWAWGWWAGLLILGIALVWVVQLGRLAYRRLNISYRLTNQRFFHERGILRRVTDRIEVIDMDDITFEQGVVERFVGVGTIRIRSSDATDPEICLHGIDEVRRVAGLIDDARRAERMRRGLHIEAV